MYTKYEFSYLRKSQIIAMLKCKGERCPIQVYCRHFQQNPSSEADVMEYSPVEIADGLVSCSNFLYNNREYIETLTLEEIVALHLRSKHNIQPHNILEGTYAQRTLDVRAVQHIETNHPRSVFAVYSIFDESETSDHLFMHSISLVLTKVGRVSHEFGFPPQHFEI